MISRDILLGANKIVHELIVLDVGDRCDMLLGLPWIARHDTVIIWKWRTAVRYRNSSAKNSDGPASIAEATLSASLSHQRQRGARLPLIAQCHHQPLQQALGRSVNRIGMCNSLEYPMISPPSYMPLDHKLS
ncbi:unnamed protein product [Phytophthora fragariaefolia]|uniref:Unnamed protein product n=1 Tax=Phytophthora fragariaefolia TaxID=1490495 RepID=A0A9W6XZA1_9STRA|nr:unnamed protein product [Phytophthora fragariaefolia]